MLFPHDDQLIQSQSYTYHIEFPLCVYQCRNNKCRQCTSSQWQVSIYYCPVLLVPSYTSSVKAWPINPQKHSTYNQKGRVSSLNYFQHSNPVLIVRSFVKYVKMIENLPFLMFRMNYYCCNSELTYTCYNICQRLLITPFKEADSSFFLLKCSHTSGLWTFEKKKFNFLIFFIFT